MKTFLAITFLCLVLVCLAFPPASRASWWVDELGSCSNVYVNQANDINYWYATNQIDEQQWRDLHDYISGTYTGCLSYVYPAPQEPDFCAAALAASQDCIFQAQNLTYPDLGFASECRLKSGIDLCQ